MQEKEMNNLFPVFLKLENMVVLIVGGGKVGLEKITVMLSNAPQTTIRLVAETIHKEIHHLAEKHRGLQLHERLFLPADLSGVDIVIIAINDPHESARISSLARQHHKLVNVADKPDQCDFYMGSIVQKGQLKIAISTNGKSPTIAKRLKEVFQEILPDELEQILEQMQRIRSEIKGDFTEKVKRLNEITRELTRHHQH